MSAYTPLEQVLSAIEDIVCTQRFQSYVVNPASPPAADRVVAGYQPRFDAPYLDPDAFTDSPCPDFMGTAILRCAAAVLEFVFMSHNDRIRPDVRLYTIKTQALEQLRAVGYDVWMSAYFPEYESECLCLQLPVGILFVPFNVIEQWSQEMNESLTEAALMGSM